MENRLIDVGQNNILLPNFWDLLLKYKTLFADGRGIESRN